MIVYSFANAVTAFRFLEDIETLGTRARLTSRAAANCGGFDVLVHFNQARSIQEIATLVGTCESHYKSCLRQYWISCRAA